jgi:hypothetical protein
MNGPDADKVDLNTAGAQEAEQAERAENDNREQCARARVIRWAGEYLVRPHPDLGRNGPVCPFVEGSMKRDLFLVEHQAGRFVDPAEVAEILRGTKQRFLDREPRFGPDAQYKTILVAFPEMGEHTEVLDRAQALLKPEFTDVGLMIGQFHPRPPPLPGLWNQEFRPFYSPVPLLAVRHMVAGDLPFLNMESRFVMAYLKHWGGSVPHRLRGLADELCDRFELAVQPPAGG